MSVNRKGGGITSVGVRHSIIGDSSLISVGVHFTHTYPPFLPAMMVDLNCDTMLLVWCCGAVVLCCGMSEEISGYFA